MKLKRFSIGTLGLLAVSGLAWSCSGKATDCNANLDCAPYGGQLGSSGASGASGRAGANGASGTPGASGDGAVGGESNAGAGGASAPMCDGALSPDADDCVIADQYGLFVAPAADEATADGSRAHPFATVTAALASITSTIKRVYICAADYNEPDTLQIRDKVAIFGGFTCKDGDWKYDSPRPAHLLPANPIGATISDATVGVTIQDVRIDAQDAANDDTGASSFGLMIVNSENISLKGVDIRAGRGGKGKAGADGATGAEGLASGVEQNGVAGSCTNPPASTQGPKAVTKICESQGGLGGNASVGISYVAGQDGGSGYLVSPSNGGKGGDVAKKNANNGGNGDNGATGERGAAAPQVGTFSKDAYQLASGGSGGPGKPGQGGGGGGASLGTATCIGATGGAGGMGGCGGDPGTGGMGGGASVAVLSWRSTVSLDGCKLTANIGGAGGDGGRGHAGGAGKAGGTGGIPDGQNNVGKGGNGGDGGYGGNGGNGAGGSGGPSIALVYDGTMPKLSGATSLTFASVAAAAGKGGVFGPVEDAGADGTKGLTQDVYSKPQ